MLDCCFNLQSKLNLLSFREYVPEIHDVPPKKNFAVGVFREYVPEIHDVPPKKNFAVGVFGTEETIFLTFS